MMTQNNLGLPDIQALVAFGKLGLALTASRILSITALFGVVALAAYSVYAQSWQGVAGVAIIAWLVFRPCLAAESKIKEVDHA